MNEVEIDSEQIKWLVEKWTPSESIDEIPAVEIIAAILFLARRCRDDDCDRAQRLAGQLDHRMTDAGQFIDLLSDEEIE